MIIVSNLSNQQLTLAEWLLIVTFLPKSLIDNFKSRELLCVQVEYILGRPGLKQHPNSRLV